METSLTSRLRLSSLRSDRNIIHPLVVGVLRAPSIGAELCTLGGRKRIIHVNGMVADDTALAERLGTSVGVPVAMVGRNFAKDVSSKRSVAHFVSLGQAWY